ncbi:MAG: ferritin [Elusimicrobia bacterium]|nr:ferritin [Elusimicrobiota bacterium]
MLDKKMQAALGEQATKEFYSAYLYMAMASHLEAQVLPGLAKWMRVQAQEESCHALIFFNYICERGSKVELGVIKAPPKDFKSVTEVFKHTVAHEREVTASIHGIAELAASIKDHATKQFLEWFVAEQVEEENAAETMLRQAARLEDDKALFLLDKEASARVFVLPAPLAGKV